MDDLLREKVGNDPDDLATILEGGTAYFAHEAEVGAAIDEGVPLLGDAAASTISLLRGSDEPQKTEMFIGLFLFSLPSPPLRSVAIASKDGSRLSFVECM